MITTTTHDNSNNITPNPSTTLNTLLHRLTHPLSHTPTGPPSWMEPRADWGSLQRPATVRSSETVHSMAATENAQVETAQRGTEEAGLRSGVLAQHAQHDVIVARDLMMRLGVQVTAALERRGEGARDVVGLGGAVARIAAEVCDVFLGVECAVGFVCGGVVRVLCVLAYMYRSCVSLSTQSRINTIPYQHTPHPDPTSYTKHPSLFTHSWCLVKHPTAHNHNSHSLSMWHTKHTQKQAHGGVPYHHPHPPIMPLQHNSPHNGSTHALCTQHPPQQHTTPPQQHPTLLHTVDHSTHHVFSV